VRPRRVLLGMTEVAGYFGNLERGFRSIGVEADFVDRSADVFEYRPAGLSQRVANTARRARDRSRERPATTRARAWGGALRLARALRKLGNVGLLARAAWHYDAFVFGWDDSLLPGNVDLPVLRRLGKRIVWVFLGSDHRPAYLSGRAARADGPDGVAGVIAESRRRRARVRLAERHADWIVALPASAQFHTRPFVHFLRMGIPFAPRDGDTGTDPFAGSGVRILHAPSDPLSKGTDAIRACIEGLRAEGLSIDYVELSGTAHREVVAAIRACDLVVDEVYSDTPIAVLATEAAWFGKPTVVTGYFASSIRDELPAEVVPPTAFALPDQLFTVIRGLVVDEAERRALGERARRFVAEQWAPATIAERFVRLMDGEAPSEWTVTPDDLRYVHGWGLTEDDARSSIRAVIAAGGPEALLLDAQPRVRERVIGFAEGASEAMRRP
jgi:hypothetical protein